MIKGVATYGTLLALTLVFAYVRWTAEPEVDTEGKVVVLQGDADAIERVVWRGEDDLAVLERKSDSVGDFFWVTYTKYEEVDKDESPFPNAEHARIDPEEHDGDDAEGDGHEGHDHGEETPEETTGDEAAGEAEAEPEIEEKVTVFKAGETAEELMADLSPLIAVRKLDDVGADKLETIELSDPEQYVEIHRSGRTTKFDLGGEAYGTRDRYLRNAETGEIFLVDDEVLRPLKYARTRLPDRTLFAFETDKIQSAEVGDSAASLKLTHKNKDDQKKATWVPADNPEDTADAYKTWMDKFLRLKASTYADPNEPPQDLELRFQVTLKTEGGDTETIEVYQEGADGDWYARSAHTREYVKMLKSSTSALAQDVTDLIISK